MAGVELISKTPVDGFKFPPNHSASEEVLIWFEQYIQTHQVTVGEALPSEDLIVQYTGMSRTSVREALTRLRAMGIIDSRRKRGMKLKRPISLIGLIRLLDSTAIPQPQQEQIGQVCRALEIGLETEIFRQATVEQLDALRSIYFQMKDKTISDQYWQKLDQSFQESLIANTQNTIAAWLLQLFHPTPINDDALPVHPNTANAALKDAAILRQRHIISALENNDPIAFHLALREHHEVTPPVERPPLAAAGQRPGEPWLSVDNVTNPYPVHEKIS